MLGNKKYYVSWSGGVDSTFVVTQLSQFPVVIQPVYFRGQTFRLSEPQELSAIDTITCLLQKDVRTRAKLLPICIIEKDDPRIKNREIISAHRRIYIRLLEEYKTKCGGKLPPAGSQQIYEDGAFISSQYIAMASFAKNCRCKLYVGWLRDDLEHLPVKLSQLSYAYDEMSGIKLSFLDKVDVEDSMAKDVHTLIKDFCFPIIGQDMYKQDIWKWYEINGYQKIRSHTIFCQAPIVHSDGSYEPCGMLCAVYRSYS